MMLKKVIYCNQSIDDMLPDEILRGAKTKVREEVTGFMENTYNLLKEFLTLYENNFTDDVLHNQKEIKSLNKGNEEDSNYSKDRLTIRLCDAFFYKISSSKGYTIKFNVSKKDDDTLVEISSLYPGNFTEDKILSPQNEQQIIEKISSLYPGNFTEVKILSPQNEQQIIEKPNYEKFCNGILRAKIDENPNDFNEAYHFLKRVSEYLINKIEPLKDIVDSNKSYSATLPRNEPKQPNEL